MKKILALIVVMGAFAAQANVTGFYCDNNNTQLRSLSNNDTKLERRVKNCSAVLASSVNGYYCDGNVLRDLENGRFIDRLGDSESTCQGTLKNMKWAEK